MTNIKEINTARSLICDNIGLSSNLDEDMKKHLTSMMNDISDTIIRFAETEGMYKKALDRINEQGKEELELINKDENLDKDEKMTFENDVKRRTEQAKKELIG